MAEVEKQPEKSPLCGLLVVDKPLYWSSARVVRWVKRAAGGVKTGHAGTLDPLATGVVICCLGRATKAAESLMGLAKVYETAIDLSAFSTTDDLEGQLQPVDGAHVNPGIDEARVREVLRGFEGEIEQRPPVFSALHVDGKRAYKMAREGKEVKLAKRVVRVDAVELLSFSYPRLEVRITCGKGTYIRSMARDIGKALGVGGHLIALRRTAVGEYTEDVAVAVEKLKGTIGQGDLIEVPEFKRD